MRTYSIFYSLAIATCLAGASSCTVNRPNTEPEGKAIPTSADLMDWKLLCADGRIVAHFYGTHADALASGACAPSHVSTVWDNGLRDYGWGPPFLGYPGVLAIPRIEMTPATGATATLAVAVEARRRELLSSPGAACAQAICQDSRRNRYEVNFLHSRGNGTRLNCAAAGLVNGGRARTVPAIPNGGAATCRPGPSLRSGTPR
jgi:hypothetical protein